MVLEWILVTLLIEVRTRRDNENHVADHKASVHERLSVSMSEVLENIRCNDEVVPVPVVANLFKRFVCLSHHENVIQRALHVTDVGFVALDAMNCHCTISRSRVPGHVPVLPRQKAHSATTDTDV